MRKAKFQKQLTIAISHEHFQQIKIISDQEEISIAEYCREAIAKALKHNYDDRSNLQQD